MKNNMIKLTVILAILAFLPALARAGDVEVELNSSDGSTSFEVLEVMA